jgi:hypothetical protein
MELSQSKKLIDSFTERLRRTKDDFEAYKQDGSKRKETMPKLKRKVRELENMVEEAEGERIQRSVLDECTILSIPQSRLLPKSSKSTASLTRKGSR